MKQASSTAEVTLRDDNDQAGSAETDLRVQSEQRATQELHRFQKLSMQTPAAGGATEPTDLQDQKLPCWSSH